MELLSLLGDYLQLGYALTAGLALGWLIWH